MQTPKRWSKVQKTLKKPFSTSVWHVQHPNPGPNIQQSSVTLLEEKIVIVELGKSQPW